MKAKLVYKSLLILINAFACFFLGLIFIGSFSMNDEAANPLNEQQVLVRIIMYGIGISLFFSIINNNDKLLLINIKNFLTKSKN